MTRGDGLIAVVGLGNELMGDDAIGAAVVRDLERRVADGGAILPPGTELIDGGTAGLDLLPAIAGARALVLVDAADRGLPPGTVVVIRGASLLRAAAPAAGRAALDELLATADQAGLLPPDVVLVAVQVATVEPGRLLGAAVAAALPEAVDAVRKELRLLEDTISSAGRAAGHAKREVAVARA